MTGSRDIEGLEDLMSSRDMTQLEAIMYSGLLECRIDHMDWDDDDLARGLAKFLIDHLPEVHDDDDDRGSAGDLPSPTVE